MSSGQGSGGNVLAPTGSFLIPGPGRLAQGHWLKARLTGWPRAMFVLAGLLWIVWMGWLIHRWSIMGRGHLVDAAMFKPRTRT